MPSATTRTYLDYNATSPLRPEAREAMLAAMDVCGNPSSVHAEGRAARSIVENARVDVARLCGVAPRAVTFVSSGTEAANTALNAHFGSGPSEAPLQRLILSAGEHACVLHGGRFPVSAVEVAPLRGDGCIDLDWIESALRRPGRALLALQGANNETGVIQPVFDASTLVHAAGGRVFCDAVQLAGRTDCNLSALGADAIALSAHKMGGPKGVGAIATASAAFGLGEPLIRGGGQERGGRAGTENVAGIAGFGAAARSSLEATARERARLRLLRDRLSEAVRGCAPDAVIFGETAPRISNTLCFGVPGCEAATLMIALDLAGVATSSGSACSSGKVTPSHVLSAMGAPAGSRALRNPIEFGMGIIRPRRRALR